MFNELSDWLIWELYGWYIAGLQKGVKASIWNKETEKYKYIKLKLTNRGE
jgi:hypothetical protein